MLKYLALLIFVAIPAQAQQGYPIVRAEQKGAYTVTVYDSTFTSTADIIAVVNTAKTSVGNINYDLPFDNGLYIVPSGTIGDLTLVYE